MNHMKDEDSLGKAFDLRLMKRLLKYARPYAAVIALCVMLLMLITAAELLRPKLIQIAIDDYIKGINIPLIGYNEKPPFKSVELDGKYYVRQNEIEEQAKSEVSIGEENIYQLIKHQDSYYIYNGSLNIETSEMLIVEKEGKYYIQENHSNIPLKPLTKEQYLDFRQQDLAGITKVSLWFLATITLGFILNFIQVYILYYTGQKIIYNMRKELFSHLQKLSLSFFDKNPVGRLVTRITNDMENLNEMYTGVLVNLFKDVFLLVGIIVVMLNMNLRLALVSFTVIPLIVLAAAIFKRKAREAYRLVRVKLAKINATLSENISGMRIIQIFKKEDFKYNEFEAINQEHRTASMKELLVFAVFRPSMDLIYSLALALLIWYGGARVLSNALSFGILFAFVNYIDSFFKPIMDLTEKFNILQSAMSSSERIFILLDEEEGMENSKLPIHSNRAKGEIEFKNVWFAYSEENWVLRDVSFKINPGETAAFVGATGAGKTSIISLISRLYDIQKGEILIDGKNIKEIDKYELRKQIGTVLQDVFLFTGDIMSNIRLNSLEISEEKIKEVAQYVNANKFIENLPKGYHEEVKERGATLSSGQRQLLAFARALAFDPSILVLDEATSNIDTETEILIQDAIKKVIKNRTTIVIAHRLSTIQHADKIIVLHKGKIRELGNHQELLDKKGMYYDLYLLQYKECFQEASA
ncbi:MAG: lipid transporter permease/ATP-binding protein [Clostridia bacterium]|nr:lipid transporter permease/ATP-binding protein [Clostridia bacterium]